MPPFAPFRGSLRRTRASRSPRRGTPRATAAHPRRRRRAARRAPATTRRPAARGARNPGWTGTLRRVCARRSRRAPRPRPPAPAPPARAGPTATPHPPAASTGRCAGCTGQGGAARDPARSPTPRARGARTRPAAGTPATTRRDGAPTPTRHRGDPTQGERRGRPPRVGDPQPHLLHAGGSGVPARCVGRCSVGRCSVGRRNRRPRGAAAHEARTPPSARRPRGPPASTPAGSLPRGGTARRRHPRPRDPHPAKREPAARSRGGPAGSSGPSIREAATPRSPDRSTPTTPGWASRRAPRTRRERESRPARPGGRAIPGRATTCGHAAGPTPRVPRRRDVPTSARAALRPSGAVAPGCPTGSGRASLGCARLSRPTASPYASPFLRERDGWIVLHGCLVCQPGFCRFPVALTISPARWIERCPGSRPRKRARGRKPPGCKHLDTVLGCPLDRWSARRIGGTA